MTKNKSQYKRNSLSSRFSGVLTRAQRRKINSTKEPKEGEIMAEPTVD